MAGRESEGGFQGASRIIEHSRVFAVADAIRRSSTIGFNESRVVRLVRRLALGFGGLPSAVHTRHALLAIGIAAVSYVLMASALPRAIRPNIPLAAGVLILIVCGGVATLRPRRR
jgi:hypothetical protein